MTNPVFISLSVKNLKRSRVFFREPGFRFNPQFSDANAVCMVIRDGICGWMYHHCFADLDGHQWELVYMDADQLPIQ
jgi:predicted lactoylglutathione lyase